MRTLNIYFLFIIFIFLSGCSLKKNAYDSFNEDQKITFENWQKQYHQETKFDQILTLEKAVDIAYSYNKKLMATLEQKNVAKGKVLESLSNFFPSVLGIGGYTYLDKQPFVGRGEEQLPVGYRNNYSFTLEARQPVFHGGAIRSGYKSASYFSYLSDENIESFYQKLYFEIAKGYFDLLLSQKLLDVQQQSYQSAKEHLKEVKIKEKQGFASSYDILRAEVDVTNFEAEVIKQKNRISFFKTSFLKLLGINQEYQIDLENILDYKPFYVFKEEAIKTAFMSRPDLKAKNFEMNMQKQAVNIAKSRYFPQIDMVFDQRWGRPDPHFTTLDKWGKEWVVRLALTWDILDFGRKRGRLNQEKSVLRQKEYFLSDIKETISLEVQQTLFNLKDANEFVKSQRLDLTRAQEALKLAEVGYKQGVKTQVEVADALSAMTRSQSLYYQAIYQYNLSIVQLKLAMGVLKKES